MNAVRAQHEQVVGIELEVRGVGAGGRAVADHACGVVRRTVGRRRFAERPKGVVARQRL